MGLINFEITCDEFFENSGDRYFSYNGKDEKGNILCSGVESIEREIVNSKNAEELMLAYLNENVDRIINKKSVFEISPLLRVLVGRSTASDSGMAFIEKAEFDSPDEIPNENDLDLLQEEISKLGLDDYFDILSPSSVSESEAFITIYMGVSSEFNLSEPVRPTLEESLEDARTESMAGNGRDMDEQKPDILR